MEVSRKVVLTSCPPPGCTGDIILAVDVKNLPWKRGPGPCVQRACLHSVLSQLSFRHKCKSRSAVAWHNSWVLLLGLLTSQPLLWDCATQLSLRGFISSFPFLF